VQIKSADSTGIFVFSSCELDDVGAAELISFLRETCAAKYVDISCLGGFSGIADGVCRALSHGLRATRELRLDGNPLASCPETWQRLCSVFEDHPGIQHLSLRNCGLDDTSVEILATALVGQLTLFSVDLSSNRIGDVAIEALCGAMTENRVLLDVFVDDTDAGVPAKNMLEAVLERNRGQFEGQGGCLKLLRGLRRARAEACSQLTKMTRTPALAARTGKAERDNCTSMGHLPLSIAVPVAESRCVWLPLQPTYEEVRAAQAKDEKDAIFFDAASGGIPQELALRCGAGWRYTAAESERLYQLQHLVHRLQAERSTARERTEEANERTSAEQAAFRLRAAPMEQQIYDLKEQLANEVEATRRILKGNLAAKTELKQEKEELEDIVHAQSLVADTCQSASHGLTWRQREIAEEVHHLEAQLRRVEGEVEALKDDNERCRRLLHAARFETETERFFPHSKDPAASDFGAFRIPQVVASGGVR